MLRRQIRGGLCSQVLEMDQVIRTPFPVSRSTAYVQLFRRYTIVHANNDLLRNAVDLVNIRLAGRHRWYTYAIAST